LLENKMRHLLRMWADRGQCIVKLPITCANSIEFRTEAECLLEWVASRDNLSAKLFPVFPCRT
jgi:hypothetical protein